MRLFEILKKELKNYPIQSGLLIIILFGAFLIRTYRVGDLLGFYYDQGRDALVIWKLWHEGKLFLIGPVTGLRGIFLGPFYYYLIAPMYLIGRGNPIYPAVFLSLLSTLALFVIYYTGWKMHSRVAGLIAATIGGFSYYIILTSRWLSNPNPILLSSSLLLLSMWEIVDNKSKNWWVVAAFLIGISLHFESASAVFYIPVFVIFYIWMFIRGFWERRDRKNLFKYVPNRKITLLSIGVFSITLLPQVVFNFRHDNLLFNNFANLIFQEQAFRGVTDIALKTKNEILWGIFESKILLGRTAYTILFSTLGLIALVVAGKNRKKYLPLFAIFFTVPYVGYIFFQGNYGNFYDYYLSGYYLPFILLFALGLGEVWKNGSGKLAVFFYFIIFIQVNGVPIMGIIKDPKTGPTDITFEHQKAALDWLYEDVKGRGEFNIDVYVPPVIPYAYDYLILWQGTKRCGEKLCGNVENQVPVLYTIYEEDPPHPERLRAWLDRQKGIGEVEEQVRFGGITVERRTRI